MPSWQKNGCVPPFTHPKKSATKTQRHKVTTKRLCETSCLRAFVAKNGCVPPFTHPKKSATKTQRHKVTTKRLCETSCLRAFVAKKRMCPPFYTSEKISHKDTKTPQRDFVRLCAFVPSWQKTDVSPLFLVPPLSGVTPPKGRTTNFILENPVKKFFKNVILSSPGVYNIIQRGRNRSEWEAVMVYISYTTLRYPACIFQQHSNVVLLTHQPEKRFAILFILCDKKIYGNKGIPLWVLREHEINNIPDTKNGYFIFGEIP
ncbi:hypothetical protein [Desulfonema magnum]|uniref:Uncharacterized protein n=1 Tax=Desulfonema magnum TaxID=45655 RepID=A0A975BK20_9BACT|nr:hypothetical protein [Desulfonema magnum]QTA87082.1 Uncharacterized protein dnm_031100 [Desulfonema magnum]